MNDVIIIGAGPVGLYGAFYATLNKLNVLIIEIDEQIGGAPKKIYPEKNLYDIPGFPCVNGGDFINLLMEQLNSKKENWEIKTNTHIVDIQLSTENEYKIFDSNGHMYMTKNIIFSTGYGSFKFKTIDKNKISSKSNHIHHVVNDLNHFKNKKIVICGGGNSAIDYGNMLSSLCQSITLIHHTDQFKAMAQNVDKLKNTSNVNFILNTEIVNVGDNTIIVKNEKGEMTIEYDELLVFYGIEPINHEAIFKLPFFNNKQKIDVKHENYESISHPGIYACGNCNQLNLNNLMLHGFSQIAIAIEDICKKQKK